MPLRIQRVKNGIQFAVTIQPRSSKNEITGVHNDAVKIRLTSPPIDGSANRSCTKFLSKVFGVSPSKLKITSGISNRNKLIQINSFTKDNLNNILLSILASKSNKKESI